jgi:hypothetical protein
MSKPRLVDIDSLRPSAYNPRKADAERLELVELSLSRFGWLLPIYADVNGEILSGHQRHFIAKRMGAKKVPVVFVKEMPIERRMAINILYNRATNDMKKNESSAELKEKVFGASVQIERLKTLKKISVDTDDWYPVMRIKPQSVLRLMKSNERWTEQHGISMSAQLKSSGLPPMPIVVTESGTVVNGVARLTHAAMLGTDIIETVVVPDDVAEDVKIMLNLLSMDFNLEERYSDLLRYNSFRRKNQRVTYLTPTFLEDFLRHFVPSGNRNAAFHLDDPKHVELWKKYYGTTVIDFGAGLCDKTEILKGLGVDAVAFEPFFLSSDNETIDTEAARELCSKFLDRVADGTEWDSIFISSVLNSVPFLQDRLHIIKIVSALSSDNTKVNSCAISTESDRWFNHANGNIKKGHDTSSGGFPLDYEPRIIIADISLKPKVQKYHTAIEFKELFQSGFKNVEVFPTAKNGLVCAVSRFPKPFTEDELRAALEFEFNLPHPNGKRLGLADEAKAAFSKRLGLKL